MCTPVCAAQGSSASRGAVRGGEVAASAVHAFSFEAGAAVGPSFCF